MTIATPKPRAPAPTLSAPDSMDVEAPPPAETPAAAPAADEGGSVAVGAPAPGLDALAAVPAPAPVPAAATPQEVATTLAGLVVQVDEESAANSLFSELLLKVAQVARPVKDQERIGDWSNAEWILATSLDYYFRKGMLPLEPGKRGSGEPLRQFLATLLNRAPMAITKKFIAEEMELGEVYFKPQVVDLTKAVRTFRDQVEAFVASQRDRKYLGVSEEKSRSKNPWEARVTVPAEHRKVSDKFEQVNLGSFPTKKAAACAVFAFVEDDYRFDDEYVSKYSNRMISKEDFATMDDEMKAAAEVGRSKATAPAPAPPVPPPGIDLNDPRVAEIRAMRARERAAAASDDAVQPVAAPAPAAAEEGNAMDVTE